ncbi:MAG: RNA pseudouridine synthase, partial [Desulfobacterales bacterium]|nr:RNA pseudouridine synthase [Desulfobacterales bacterium]
MKTKPTPPNEIPILVGGKGWLIVEKPAGLSVHNEPGKDLRSLLSVRISESKKLRDRIGFSADVGLNPVHRLDRDTSGVILLAHDPEALRHFAAQFETGAAAKRYTAILHGQVSPPRGSDQWGVWKWPLTKGAGGRRDPRGKGPKKNCQTRYRILGASAHYSLVECELLTGR